MTLEQKLLSAVWQTMIVAQGFLVASSTAVSTAVSVSTVSGESSLKREHHVPGMQLMVDPLVIQSSVWAFRVVAPISR